MPRRGYTTGFGYLEPRRHIPHIRGELTEERQPNGTTRVISRDFAYVPSGEIDAVVVRAREILSK